jgi:peroxiredoxin
MKILIVLVIVSGIFAEKEISDEQKKAIAALTQLINTAPDFTLESLADSSYTLSKMKNQVILLNFWATWCGPCRMEIPDFNELYAEHHKDGFEILGIAMDGSKRSLKNFQKSYKMDYPVLYGKARSLNKISNAYGGVMALPTSVLIGRNGKIIKTYPGAILKNYNPEMYAAFIYEVEKALSVGKK